MPALRLPLTDAVLTMLQTTTTPDARPLRVGDHAAPPPVPPAVTPELPFAILYEVDAGVTGRDMDDANNDGAHSIQVTSVGVSRRSAQWMADQVRTAVLGRNTGGWVRPITPTGLVVIGRDLDEAGGATQEGDWWNVVDRFSLLTTSL